MPVCSACGADNPEGFRFCGGCAAPLGAADGRDVRKVVTAVFCDIVGSTSLAERVEPETLRAAVHLYFEAMRTATEAHGGRVEKFIGDAVVAVFGVPTLHEDDAVRAVRAAAAMRTALAALNDELRGRFGLEIETRIGIATGTIVTADGDEALLGDVLNTAARLEALASPGETLLAATTYELVRHGVVAEPTGATAVRGRSEPVSAWRLLSVGDHAPGIARSLERRMHGRERELRLLADTFVRSAEERRCALVTILGFPGVGKSRLARAFAASLAGQATVVTGNCAAYGAAITYQPIREIVEAAAGPDLRAGIAAILREEADGAEVATLVTALVTGDGGVGEEAFWAVRRFLEALSRAAPVVAIIEDIHWASPTLLDLIDYLADWIRHEPVVLVGIARPELLEARPAWGGGKPNATSLMLEGLPPTAVEQMLAERLAGVDVAAETRDQIVAAAAGVPLFLEQIAALVTEESTGAPLVPPAIQALLAARIESLDPADRSVLEAAAVEGERFHLGSVAWLRDRPETEVRTIVDLLVRRDLLHRSDDGAVRGAAFRFAHALVRDAAYDRIGKPERARLHERLAERLDDDGAADALIGYHLEQAYRTRCDLGPPDTGTTELGRRAGLALARAGRRALGASDQKAAAALLERAAAIMPVDDPARLQTLADLGFVYFELDFARALPALDEAARRARASGDRRLTVLAEVIASLVHLYASPEARPLTTVLAEAEASTAALEALGERGGAGIGLILQADALWMLGRMTEMTAVSIRASVITERTARARAVEYAVSGLMIGAEPLDVALERIRAFLAAADGNRVAEGAALASLGMVEAMLGQVEAGRAHARAGCEVIDALGNAGLAEIERLKCGYIELLAGDVAAAERDFARAGRAFAAIGDHWFVSTAVVDRGLALCQLGRHAEAVAISAEPHAPYDAEWVIKWNRIRALAFAGGGDDGDALAHANAAVAAAAATEYLIMHAEALEDRATVHEAAGRTAATRDDLVAALTLRARRGEVPGARRTQARLAALS
jgi:class 3 adenylate cyclase/tetratricopeptide (TPR) repeat protein